MQQVKRQIGSCTLSQYGDKTGQHGALHKCMLPSGGISSVPAGIASCICTRIKVLIEGHPTMEQEP